jgi:hypothetical protein
MTGVDPRIPIKPHESEYRGPPRPRGGERRSRRAGRGGGGGSGGREEGVAAGGRPLNSCKLITINQALFFGRARAG